MFSFKKKPILILLALSLISHFAFYGYPNKTVFDEVHFGKFISGYFTQEYFFDIHPPLGKLLISGVGYLTGFQPGFSFSQIGQEFSDSSYLWLRLLPTLAGSLLPIAIYFLVLQLGFSRLAAFIAGLLIILENSILVQSRFILLDAFLLLFGFSALAFYFYYRTSQKIYSLILAIVLAGLAVSVKWTGATFLGIIGLYEFIGLLRQFSLRRLVRMTAVFSLAPLLYVSFFAIHLQLLTKTGPGDAYMTTAFQKTLAGSKYQEDPNVEALSFPEKILELNHEMYRSNARLTAGHPYGSQWYSWPFMSRPIYYWFGGQGQGDPAETLGGRIYFIGNPFIWWLSTIAILYLILDLVPRRNQLRQLRSFVGSKKTELLIAGGFILNLLPFVGISRVMFLYHYMVALIFAILALVYLIDQLPNKKRVFTTLAIGSMIFFLFFAPLTYGLLLSEKSYDLRVWMKSWK